MSRGPRIRRILVALDASPHSLAAAEAAADLAALLQAELSAVFVEDAQLLNLSRSPLARQLDFLTSAVGELESAELERQMRVQARRARSALEGIAGKAGVRFSFRVTRGAVSSEILAAAEEADLVSLGRLGWSTRHKSRPGSIARGLLAQERGLTLLLERPARIRPPIFTVFDGSESGREALDLAAALLQGKKGALVVLLAGEDREDLQRQASQALDQPVTGLTFHWLGRAGVPALARALSGRRDGLLVIPVGAVPGGEEGLRHLLERVDCPVLLVS